MAPVFAPGPDQSDGDAGQPGEGGAPVSGSLVTADQVRTWLGLRSSDFDIGRADMAIRVSGGWLRGATGTAPWPDPPPEQLWSAWVELAGLAYDNPTSMSQRGVGAESDGYVITRRAEILASVAGALRVAPAPVGRFPPAPRWPA